MTIKINKEKSTWIIVSINSIESVCPECYISSKIDQDHGGNSLRK